MFSGPLAILVRGPLTHNEGGIAEAMIFTGKQCIALRGHWDDSGADPDSNRGKFIGL